MHVVDLRPVCFQLRPVRLHMRHWQDQCSFGKFERYDCNKSNESDESTSNGCSKNVRDINHINNEVDPQVTCIEEVVDSDRVRLFCKNDIEHHTYIGSKCVLSVPPADLSIDSLSKRSTIQVKEPSNAYSFITPEDPCKKRKCYLKN